MRFFSTFILFLFLFFVFKNITFAQSSYVLPYPSFMPGNKFYIISKISDEISKYLHFGDFGNYKYNLTQSDKFLVEAKTLFEYKQYLLAEKSLNKSNSYYFNINPALVNAKIKGKDISEKQNIFIEASQKHIEILEKLDNETPDDFYWVPEKESPKMININKLIDESIRMRKM